MLLLLILCWSVWAAAPASARPSDELRMPFSPSPLGYLRQWLVCGPFATPRQQGVHAGLTTDFLGGEAVIHPVEGMEQHLPDGTHCTWNLYASKTDRIDFKQACIGLAEQVVGYAYTEVYRPTAIKSVLAVGSDDGARVYLNGSLVLDHPVTRKAVPDEDLIGVSLRAGMNRLLVTVDQSDAGWGFYLRLLDAPRPILPNRHANHQESLSLNYAFYGNGAGGELVALPELHSKRARFALPVDVQVFAPGGTLLTGQTLHCGERAYFNVSHWPDGPYEVRASLRDEATPRLITHFTWYKGDPLVAVRAIINAAPTGATDESDGLVRTLLVAYLKDHLGPDYHDIDEDDRQHIFSALLEYQELELRRLGQGGPDHPDGFVRLAYRDEIDDSPQFGRVFLPPDYDPTKKWPLIISLHGKNDPNPDYLHWGNIVQHYDSLADRYHVIMLYPHGHGNSFYQDIGETDVLRCLAMAKARFPIDEDRVYLTGYSMGGAGTWHVGTHHPELFAALAPIFGGREYRVTKDERYLAQLSPRQLYRLERIKSSFTNAESLLTTPVFVNHGTADKTVNIGISRYGVALLQQWDYDASLWEHPGRGHASPIGGEDTIMEWLLAHRRVTDPRIVRIRSGDLRIASAHWARIEARENPVAFMRLEARITGPNTIRLNTDNVLQVRLSPGSALVDPAAPLRVIWNDEDIRTVAMTDGQVTLLAKGYVPPALGKGPGMEGPISDFYQTPFAIVQGTIARDPDMRYACQLAAQEAIKRWTDDQHWKPRVILDTEVTAEDVKKYSLLLIGGPAENLAAKRLGERLPLKVSASGFVIVGQVFPARDAVLQMIYPNPLNRERYIAILAATSTAGMKYRSALSGNVDASSVDFCVVDGHSTPWLAGGYFDKSWQIDERYVERGVVKP